MKTFISSSSSSSRQDRAFVSNRFYSNQQLKIVSSSLHSERISSEKSKQSIQTNRWWSDPFTFCTVCDEDGGGWRWRGSQQEVKVFQKKFLQPAFLSRGANSGPLPAAAARSRSTWMSSGSPSARGKFSSPRASFSTCRRSDRSSSASEDRDMSWEKRQHIKTMKDTINTKTNTSEFNVEHFIFFNLGVSFPSKTSVTSFSGQFFNANLKMTSWWSISVIIHAATRGAFRETQATAEADSRLNNKTEVRSFKVKLFKLPTPTGRWTPRQWAPALTWI